MKKVIFLAATLFLGFMGTQAQSFKIGAGPVLSIPVGNLKDANGIGIGAELTGILEFSESFQAFGQVGYQSFMAKTVNVFGTTIKGEPTSHIPFIFGARYHSNGLLVGAGLGYGTHGKGASGFTFSPQLGYSMEKIDLVGHFTSSSIGGASLSYIGVKTYYKF
jgi:hypothetical protein